MSEALVRLRFVVGKVLGCSWESISTAHDIQSTSWVRFHWSGRISILFYGICSVIVEGMRPLPELVYPYSVWVPKGVWFWGSGYGIFPPCRCSVLGWGIGVFHIVVVRWVNSSGVLLCARNSHYMWYVMAERMTPQRRRRTSWASHRWCGKRLFLRRGMLNQSR